MNLKKPENRFKEIRFLQFLKLLKKNIKLLYIQWDYQNPVKRQSQNHFHVYHIAKYHATVHVVLNYAEKLIIVF